MMESCFNNKLPRADTIEVEDLRRDLRFDLTEIAETQDSNCLDKEFLQVYLRIRPFSQAEFENGESQDCVTIQHPDTVLLKAPRSSLSARSGDKSVPQTAQRFQFSQVFGADTLQKDLFEGTVRNLVRDVLEGKNSLVFTYGVTNAGKTFTFLGPEHDVGILPRSLNMIFSNLEGRIFTQPSVKPHRCQDVLKLNKEQEMEENVSKRSLFRLLRENDSQKNTSSLSSSSRSEGFDLADPDSSASDRSSSLHLDFHTRFSVWVSFCEIYNENIHDLLEQPSGTGTRRANLRLCQDTKGNSFIKDLRWVQVNSPDEAFKVMKLGKKNQSISSTKLNQLSSRSHSIFTVRILRIEDVASLSVQSVSELSLCDLAGSERCYKTQNRGDRLKEAGNINTSLLSLGKCINALRGNGQARQHVPFRESKLTHYLQGFFTGRGRAAMIVNINQCASMYDETLNVLKFSAVAQKVVVLSIPSVLPLVVKRSAREVSFIINKATRMEARRTSLVRWEHSRREEDEVSDDDEEEDDVDESLLQDTLQEEEGKETVLLDKEVYENQLLQLEELQEQLRLARAEAVAVESRIREEVTKEFSELFTQMQNDYNERISKERELMEERCENRLEIFKQLVEKTTGEPHSDGEDPAKEQDREPPSLDGMLDSMSSDLAGIRKDAEAARSCLVPFDSRPSLMLRDLETKVTELTEKLSETQNELKSRTRELEAQSNLVEELQDMRKTLQNREQRLSDLMVMCVEKDDMIAKVQAELDKAVEDCAKNSALIKDLLQQKHNCTCSEHQPCPQTRKRRQEGAGPDNIHGQPPLKKGSLKDTGVSEEPVEEDDEEPIHEVKGSLDVWNDDSSVTEVKGQVDHLQNRLHQKNEQIAALERERQTLESCVQELKSALEGEKRSCAGVLREIEQKIEAEQQRTFHSIIARMNEMGKKLSTAEKTCTVFRRTETVHKKSVIRNLEQEVTQLRREAERFGDVKASRDEVSRLQQENDSKGERVKILEQQLLEHKNIHADVQRVNFDLQAKVTNLKGVIKELEEKAALLEKESTPNQKEKIDTELPDKEAQLANREAELAAKAAELSVFQQEAQEARKREVERRRELLAVAEEAIAQKDSELQKREAEMSRLKEEMKCSSEKLSSLSLDVQRREDESSDLREKLGDAKKQIQQVQREICSMRDVEKSLRQKLSDVEKIKSQLQNELSSRDRTIQQLRSSRSSDSKAEDHANLYEKALKDLQERQCVIEEMRLVLSEQEETQTQMDLELENRETRIHQLTQELDNLKELLLKQKNSKQFHHPDPAHSDDITRAREEAARAQDSLKAVSEKHQAERRKWTEEKLVLIAQAKDAEERRNQDMRRYAEDRERHARQHTEMDSLKACLAEREQEMDEWRKERDTLVSALEVQLKKLVSTIIEKDQQISELKRTETLRPPEKCDNGVMEQLKEKEAELERLREQLRETTHTTTESATQTVLVEESVSERLADGPTLKHTGRTRASVTSQGSCSSGPSVLDSSVISTETGRCSRFPRPELEISFSSLHPERFRLKRPGDSGEITVNVSHTRKRKSSEVERKRGSIRKSKARPSAAPQDGVESENRRNMRCKKSPGLPAHQEEEMAPALVGKSSHDSQSSLRGKKEGKLQKIGDFLNSSPTFLGSKAKRIMGLMSGRSPDEGGSSLSLTRSKRKINISSPMNISANQFISRDAEEREDQMNIKKRLRTKTPK